MFIYLPLTWTQWKRNTRFRYIPLSYHSLQTWPANPTSQHSWKYHCMLNHNDYCLCPDLSWYGYIPDKQMLWYSFSRPLHQQHHLWRNLLRYYILFMPLCMSSSPNASLYTHCRLWRHMASDILVNIGQVACCLLGDKPLPAPKFTYWMMDLRGSTIVCWYFEC